MRWSQIATVLLALASNGLARADTPPPPMKFSQVREVAPGVFFRYSAISPTDMSIFGGCNNIWIVFDNYVVVIDANFPKEAGDVIAAVRKTTEKPIRYVLNTHHHGDHAYGNAVFGKAGAQVVAQTNCARLLHVDGPKQFAEAGQGPTGRKDVAASALKTPDIVFDDKLVLEDDKQHVEFLFMGHGHTAGDAVAYLPKYKILCTGDACVNGAFNFMGHADTASWIRALEKMQQLDVKMVCPGHGQVAGRDLLERQKRYFVELRREVHKGIGSGSTAAEVAERIDLPWYKEWTGVKPTGENVNHVYAELTGTIAPYDLSEDFGALEGPSPTKEAPGWKPPHRIVVPSGLMPARLEELKHVAPEVEFLPVKNTAAAVRLAADADAVVGFWSPEIVQTGKALRWVETEEDLAGGRQGNVVVTSSRGVYGPSLAEEAFDLLLHLSRKYRGGSELHGKTMVVVGQGGSGNPVARRAAAFGMRVRLIDSKSHDKPDYVFSVDGTDQLAKILPSTDVLVVCCPLSNATRGLIGDKQLAALKTTAIVIDVGRPAVLDLSALAGALRAKKLAAAGIAYGGPLPAGRALNGIDNVVVSEQDPTSPEARERRWRLLRENVRRFAAGEPLLCVIER